MTNFLKRSPLNPKIVSASTFPFYDTLFAHLMVTGYSGTTTTTADTGIPAYQGMVKISGKAPTRPIKGANKGRAFHYHPARRLRRRSQSQTQNGDWKVRISVRVDFGVRVEVAIGVEVGV